MSDLFTTQRSRVLKAYAESGIPYDAGTKPYKSTLPLVFDVVEPHPVAAPTMAFAVMRTGQSLPFFGYGIGDAIPDGLGGQRTSTEVDTNQETGKETNGAEDYIIESVSASHQGIRVAYPEDVDLDGETVADADVNAAIFGLAVLYDPGSLEAPPQVMSPFNLEQGLFNAVAPLLQFTFEFDRKGIDEIGTLDEVPEGGAKSFLRSSGDPRTDNRYKLPEGKLWRKSGEVDSKFVCRLTSRRPVVVPISLIAALLGTTPTARPIPSKIVLDLTLRVHGLSVAPPSKNCVSAASTLSTCAPPSKN